MFCPCHEGCTLSEAEIEIIAESVKRFCFKPIKISDKEKAQVTHGGVVCAEINCETMESKLQSGLYLTGELLNVDGDCGGFNLQWAWTSGALAGIAAGGGQRCLS